MLRPVTSMTHRCRAIGLMLSITMGLIVPAGAATPWLTTPEPVVDPALALEIDAAPLDINDGWPRSSLSEGIDPLPIATLLEPVDDGSYVGIDSVVLARHGRLVLDRYFGDYGVMTRPHQTRSAFKSVTGLLVGIAR